MREISGENFIVVMIVDNEISMKIGVETGGGWPGVRPGRGSTIEAMEQERS